MRIENESERDDALCRCLDGEEKIIHSQKTAEKYLNRFLFHLKYGNKSFAACEAMEQLLPILFPDENYQYYHNLLQYNALNKAYLLCEQKHYDQAMEELQKARFHAGEMVKYSRETHYRFTSPLFDHVYGVKNETDSEVTDTDDFISCLNNNSCFDPIRDSEDFRSLIYHHLPPGGAECSPIKSSLLIEICKANLRGGFHPVIITILKRVHTALNLAEDAELAGRVEVWDIQQFLSGSVYEHNLFDESKICYTCYLFRYDSTFL